MPRKTRKQKIAARKRKKSRWQTKQSDPGKTTLPSISPKDQPIKKPAENKTESDLSQTDIIQAKLIKKDLIKTIIITLFLISFQLVVFYYKK